MVRVVSLTQPTGAIPLKTKLWIVCVAVVAAAMSARADEAPATNAAAPEAAAPAKDWSVTMNQDYFSQYIFRGVDLTGNNAIWVPSVVGKYKNLQAYYYGYIGSGYGNHTYQEADFGADLTVTAFEDKLGLTAGVVSYIYPSGSADDTYEFYGKATWANYFNPYVGLNWDVHVYHGGYGFAGISHTYDLTEKLKIKSGQTFSITPSAQLGIDFGYNSRQTQSNVNWNDVLLGIGATYGVTSQLSVRAMYQASIALNSVHEVGTGNESIANIGVTYAF
jgi:hypothetical protein